MNFAETMTIQISRTLRKGEKNRNLDRYCPNLDEKIQEAIDMNNGELPITLSIGPDPLVINPNDVIGFVTSFDNTTVSCKLIPYGIKLMRHGVLEKCTVQFGYLFRDDDSNQDNIIAHRVIKAALTIDGKPDIIVEYDVKGMFDFDRTLEHRCKAKGMTDSEIAAWMKEM